VRAPPAGFCSFAGNGFSPLDFSGGERYYHGERQEPGHNSMSDRNKPPSSDELGDRISKARRHAGLEDDDEADDQRLSGAAMGAAWRMSIEIVVALFVCTGIGWALDKWFGTKPWLMLAFLVLGAAAGINNAVRTAMRMDAEATEALLKKGKGGDGKD
jgi:ATP synthase protein I